MNDYGIRKNNLSDTFSSRGYYSGSEQFNEEEEQLRQLFISCDSNNDGKLNRNDLICMCQKLNMEEYSDDIISVLGANSKGSEITFSDFIRCRTQIQRLYNKNNHNSPEYLVHSPYYSHPNQEDYNIDSSSDISVIYSSVDNDADNKDINMNNPSEEPLGLHAMLQQAQPDLYCRWLAMEREKPNGDSNNTLSQQILNYANQIHLSRINRMYTELKIAVRRISSSNTSRELCQQEINRLQKEKERLNTELSNQASRYEDRLTELHGVIGELQKKFQTDPYYRANGGIATNYPQQHTILEEDEDLSSYPGGVGIASNYLIGQLVNGSDRNNNTNTEDYEKLDLSGHRRRSLQNCGQDWSSSMETSAICSQKDYPLIPTSTTPPPPPTSSTTQQQQQQQQNKNTCTQTNESLLRTELFVANIQKDDHCEGKYEEQVQNLHNTHFYLQEKLSSYESLVCSLRNQLASVMEEKECLKRQLRDIQENQSIVLPDHHHQSSTLHSNISIANSKISLDSSKSTNSSSSSPARPIMGVRQQNKVIQQKSSQTNQEPDWVIRAVNKYNQAVHHTKDSNTNTNTILISAHNLLQELSENIPYSSMLEPLRRIVLEWQRFMAQNDRESADTLLLQATLSESKSISDQLQCWVAQLQSDASALARSNMLADQIIELLDVLVQFRETESLCFNQSPGGINSTNNNVGSNNQSMSDSVYYQNHYSSINNHMSTVTTTTTTGIQSHGTTNTPSGERLKQGYRDQVETAARLLLARLEDGMNGLCLKGGGSTSVMHGRQTPDSGAGISSTISSGSVDVDGILRNGTNSIASTPSLHHKNSISSSSYNQMPHTQHKQQLPPAPSLNDTECRVKRALDLLSYQRNRTRQSIVTTSFTSTSTTSTTTTSLTAAPNNPILPSQSSLRTHHLFHNQTPQYSTNTSQNSLHRHLPRASEADLISIASTQYSIENTVLLQEVCSLKEERVNLKTRLYLLEKEIQSLQLSLESKSSNEKALKLQLAAIASTSTSSSTNNNESNNDSLKSALEELRVESACQQEKSEELINDLKLANGNLISAFEKVKRKYQLKLKSLETQLNSVSSQINTNRLESEETAL